MFFCCIALSMLSQTQARDLSFFGVTFNRSSEQVFQQLKKKGLKPDLYRSAMLKGDFQEIKDAEFYILEGNDHVCYGLYLIIPGIDNTISNNIRNYLEEYLESNYKAKREWSSIEDDGLEKYHYIGKNNGATGYFRIGKMENENTVYFEIYDKRFYDKYIYEKSTHAKIFDIPLKGSLANMKQKLQQKGFVYDKKSSDEIEQMKNHKGEVISIFKGNCYGYKNSKLIIYSHRKSSRVFSASVEIKSQMEAPYSIIDKVKQKIDASYPKNVVVNFQDQNKRIAYIVEGDSDNMETEGTLVGKIHFNIGIDNELHIVITDELGNNVIM